MRTRSTETELRRMKRNLRDAEARLRGHEGQVAGTVAKFLTGDRMAELMREASKCQRVPAKLRREMDTVCKEWGKV